MNLVCRLLLEKKNFFNDTATTEIYTPGYTLSLHDALPICRQKGWERDVSGNELPGN